MSIIPIEDINYLAEQSSGKINMILSGMTALMNDTDNKVETMESQGWFKRMVKTVSGKNKLTKDEIRKNHDKLNAYMSEAIAELYNRNCIDEKVMMSLGIQLNELYADHVQLKQMLGAFVSKLNEKIDSVDNFHMLTTEINQGVYSFDTPIFSICKIISQFDKRILEDSRKLDIIRRSMVSQNIINGEQIILTDYLNHILQISVEEIGQIYLELGTIKDNFISKVILGMIEEYHFLPDMARKIKNKDGLIKKVIENENLDGTITLSISDIYDDFINSKLDINETLLSINTIESNLNSKEVYNELDDTTLERAEQLYINGKFDDALELFKVLEKEGNVRAIYFIGKYYECGYSNIKIDLDKAKEYYKIAANNNFIGAATELGKIELNKENYIEAVQWFRKDAENGYADAQNRLGVRYHNGQGVEVDYKEAFKWYLKAAEQGYDKAQYNIGVCYYYGEGVPIDYEKSIEWLRKASSQGYDEASRFLREIFEEKYELIGGLCKLFVNKYPSKFKNSLIEFFEPYELKGNINDYWSEVYLGFNNYGSMYRADCLLITNNGIFITKRTDKWVEIDYHISFNRLAKSSEISVKDDSDIYIDGQHIASFYDDYFGYYFKYREKDNSKPEFIELLNSIKKLAGFEY